MATRMGRVQNVEQRKVETLREHPEAHLVPEMSVVEWTEFFASIEEHGVRDPLHVTSGDVVLDGRHRLRAARALDLAEVPILVVDVPEAEQVAYLVDAATLRRQLSKSQLAAIAVDMVAFEEERAEGRQRMEAGARRARKALTRVSGHGKPPAGSEVLSRERLGARVGVSGILIQSALRIKKADAALHALVKKGEINIPEATRRLKEREKLGRVVSAPRATRSPRLYVGDAEHLDMLNDESINIIVTSPPWNIGTEQGQIHTKANRKIGDERVAHGVAWRGPDYERRIPERDYQAKQVRVLAELFRVARVGASLFFHHKLRQLDNELLHPLDFLRRTNWTIRQEIVIDRESTHQNNPRYFTPTADERLFWMVKGRVPKLPRRPINLPTLWRLPQRGPESWHPCPLLPEIVRRCLEAVGFEGAVVLDPFAGSAVVPRVALEMGMDAIGVEIRPDYVERAARENGWSVVNRTLA